MDNKNLGFFLVELSSLSKDYGIYIGGCGCCESPYLLENPDEERGDLYWDKKRKRYWHDSLDNF